MLCIFSHTRARKDVRTCFFENCDDVSGKCRIFVFTHTQSILTHVCAARLSQKRTLSCVKFSRDIWFPACSVFPLNCEAVGLDVHSAIFICFVVGTASEVVTQQGQCEGYGAILASTMDGVLSRSYDGVCGICFHVCRSHLMEHQFLFCFDVQGDFNCCIPMLAPREDPSADFVWPLASFDGAALSFMGTSQNVPDTLVFHFEAGADSATLDMPVVLQRQALVTERNLDMPVVLQMQAMLADRRALEETGWRLCRRALQESCDERGRRLNQKYRCPPERNDGQAQRAVGSSSRLEGDMQVSAQDLDALTRSWLSHATGGPPSHSHVR